MERALDLIAADEVEAAVLDVNLSGGATGYAPADCLAGLDTPFLFATEDVQRSGPAAHQARPRLIKP